VRFKPRISRQAVHRRSQRLVFIIGGAAVLIALLAADRHAGRFRFRLVADAKNF
jgi:hypothetical protein